ncbi:MULTISPECIES: DUF7547 family protein [Haloarcula]|uniref:Uncharacterized protein n=1 Tax=Haloarcula pellucida TaxID=1427151 RepID=A0A830GIV0_9EURY|nr:MULTISPECIES: hypothetical protein [Halomicroarcula]MBX0347507.1 hypothetical protein [Halomicroarcula pellucida]MDS0276619.1 hypothetical protein [Halomicroarcula sp. S1AR25-4]GGN89011.1 hypothetical protein GCM10009030_09320 [Halomicroarcula pellucida]
MSASSGDDITALLTDLVRTLRDLETEMEPTTESGRPRPPTPKELLRFTSDVTIPAAILVLKTNVEALKLLRRALRMAEGRPTSTGSGASEVRRRATTLSKATLTRLDDALTDLQDAVEGRPQDEDARELLEEARELRSDLAEQLAETQDDDTLEGGIDEVPVDVDAELESIKDDLEDAENGRDDDGDGGNDDV